MHFQSAAGTISKYTMPCEEIAELDRRLVGMKCDGLRKLIAADVRTPRGFVVTVEAFRTFLNHNHLCPLISAISRRSSREHGFVEELAALQEKIAYGELPEEIQEVVRCAALLLGESSLRFAVRSSCDFEDLPGLSFAGLYESFLNVTETDLAKCISRCYASICSLRCVTYLEEHGIRLEELGMSVLIQELIDAEAAGTLFTAEPTSAFDGLHYIEGVWGFGQGVVAGSTGANSWTVSKSGGRLLGRSLGSVQEMYVAGSKPGLARVPMPSDLRDRYCLGPDDVERLGSIGRRLEEIEKHPLDIEWVKSRSGEIVLVQMRPLKVQHDEFFSRYTVLPGQDGQRLLTGLPVTQETVCGRVRLGFLGQQYLTKHDVLVVSDLDVDWLPYIKDVGGIITERGGYTSHLSIILREHRIPAILSAEGACTRLREDQVVTLICSGSEGTVWDGALNFRRETVDLQSIRKPHHRVGLVSSTLAHLDQYLRLPIDGIGLVRLEFVIHEKIGIHPLALLDYDAGAAQAETLKRAIEARTREFESKREFYVETLTQGICAFACRYPRGFVNIRAPDFITGDYLVLLGGEAYEEAEDTNPMLGWRGVSRLIHADYVRAFEMDCEAFRRAREVHGFRNINILTPFCRTPADGRAFRAILAANGLESARVGMMVEIPSNIMLARQFADIFDFFLVGPMDLTQLTYGADRTSGRLSHYCNETEAVKELVKHFLREIAGLEKDIFIGGWPLFQYLPEYTRLKGNNRLHMVELPDRLLELFDKLNALEQSMEKEDS